eukprot:TRINITY_DN678_c0_g2_i1.p1 TRINITY_DN678_c0_g2~~TRINITY_DN678_c0_g2_i1.p1  ORF type:complete len:305 (-),score=71.58 TRINITY_DN678_c0_g2_i1:1274-2188(-)
MASEDAEVMEMKRLVVLALEQKGAMAKLRADVRASVFSVIQEQERKRSNVHLESPELIALREKKDGKYAVDLFIDFLQQYNLTNTLSVFLAEVNMPPDVTVQRERVANSLGIQNTTSNEPCPLIYELFHRKVGDTFENVSNLGISSSLSGYSGEPTPNGDAGSLHLFGSNSGRISQSLTEKAPANQTFTTLNATSTLNHKGDNVAEPPTKAPTESVHRSSLQTHAAYSSASKQSVLTDEEDSYIDDDEYHDSRSHQDDEDNDELNDSDSEMIRTAEHSVAEDGRFSLLPDYQEPHVPGQMRLEL